MKGPGFKSLYVQTCVASSSACFFCLVAERTFFISAQFTFFSIRANILDTVSISGLSREEAYNRFTQQQCAIAPVCGYRVNAGGRSFLFESKGHLALHLLSSKLSREEVLTIISLHWWDGIDTFTHLPFEPLFLFKPSKRHPAIQIAKSANNFLQQRH